MKSRDTDGKIISGYDVRGRVGEAAYKSLRMIMCAMCAGECGYEIYENAGLR